jgi:hypothetical protein
MVEKYKLLPTAYGDVSPWRFLDFVFAWDYDVIADGSKARRHGFHEFIDTEEMFRTLFDDFKTRRLLP